MQERFRFTALCANDPALHTALRERGEQIGATAAVRELADDLRAEGLL